MLILRLRRLAAPALIFFAALHSAPTLADDDTVLNLLHMLDYIGVDYSGAVRNGAVVSGAEYREQREFASEVTKDLQRLNADQGLRQQAAVLERKIEARASADEIRTATQSLTQALLAAYPVAVAPKRAPDLALGQRLYQENCASCHGAHGAADGPAAAALDPPPLSFLDPQRQDRRSLFALYNTLGTGVPGTAMPSFARLPEAQRWALAFYVSQLRYGAEQRDRGAQLWQQKAAPARVLPDLTALTQVEPASFQQRFGADGAAVLAYLRSHPEVLQDQREPLVIASTRLKQSRDAYLAGRAEEASQLAVSAYLDGFELAEAQLATLDQPLMRQIEAKMMGYRSLIKSRPPVEKVAAAQEEIEDLLDQARERLLGGPQSAVGSFVGSFIILAREGLEAILVLAAMFAFLRKTERRDALPYLHGGWIGALVLGAATWAASNWLVGISGSSRELTEGSTALLAAAILLSVGLWLHNKSYSNRWQQYVAGKMKGALSDGRPWGLALLAFIAVYREIFETVLFYRALWGQGDHVAIVLGLLAAVAALAALTWAIFAVSMKLPIRQFFAWSSALIVVLAVVFTGKGIAALQEAGTITARSVHFVRVPLLGIYPNAQGLLLQGAVLLLVIGGFAWNHLGAREPAHRT